MDKGVTIAEATLPAILEAVSQFVASLESSFEHLDLATRTGIMLALQELLVNIVVHAYAHTPGEIRIRITMQADVVHTLIEDDGPNSYDIERPVQSPDLLELPENGMGMFIIQQCFDQVTYRREMTSNHWHLQKRIGVDS
jgi:anti-sigma regulatory factor (Ser/Thr protein kinase)